MIYLKFDQRLNIIQKTKDGVYKMFQWTIIILAIVTYAGPCRGVVEEIQNGVGSEIYSNENLGVNRPAERVKRVALTSLLARGFKYGVRLRGLWDIIRAKRILLADAELVDKGKNVETYVKRGGEARAKSDFRAIRPRDVRTSGSFVSKSEGIVGDSAVELINWDVGRNAKGYTIIMSSKDALKIVMYRDY